VLRDTTTIQVVEEARVLAVDKAPLQDQQAIKALQVQVVGAHLVQVEE
jgi:hypothetical protein